MAKLPLSFYQSEDVNKLSISLLGKKLVTFIDGEITSGIIVETEAYKGRDDKASHAYSGKITSRTQVVFGAGGISYVYLCYGIHHLFNIVTGPELTPHAVLVRGLMPLDGLDIMLRRRSKFSLTPGLTAGPGALAKAMGIDRTLNGSSLQDEQIWIEDSDFEVLPESIIASPRIGVAYAKEHAQLPWRYYIKGNPFVSKPHL
jgi:DNA-3-methyladenine glycosylase